MKKSSHFDPTIDPRTGRPPAPTRGGEGIDRLAREEDPPAEETGLAATDPSIVEKTATKTDIASEAEEGEQAPNETDNPDMEHFLPNSTR